MSKVSLLRRLRLSRTTVSMVDFDDKMASDLEKNPEARDWYVKFLSRYYDAGGYAQPGAEPKELTIEANRRKYRRAQDAMARLDGRYVVSDKLGAGAPCARAEADLSDSYAYRELVREYRAQMAAGVTKLQKKQHKEAMSLLFPEPE